MTASEILLIAQKAQKINQMSMDMKLKHQKSLKLMAISKVEEETHKELPSLIEKIKQTALKGNNSIEYYTGNSKDKTGEASAKANVVRKYMSGLGYKTEWKTYEPCNEGQTEDTYYLVISW